MKQIEKIKILSKSVLNDKDYNLILKFIDKRDFDSFIDIIKSELKKEYKLCEVDRVTDRYCTLQDINFLLMKYDLRDLYMDKCANYEEE